MCLGQPVHDAAVDTEPLREEIELGERVTDRQMHKVLSFTVRRVLANDHDVEHLAGIHPHRAFDVASLKHQGVATESDVLARLVALNFEPDPA
jgi:hypothetical protein